MYYMGNKFTGVKVKKLEPNEFQEAFKTIMSINPFSKSFDVYKELTENIEMDSACIVKNDGYAEFENVETAAIGFIKKVSIKKDIAVVDIKIPAFIFKKGIADAIIFAVLYYLGMAGIKQVIAKPQNAEEYRIFDELGFKSALLDFNGLDSIGLGFKNYVNNLILEQHAMCININYGG